MATAAPSTTPQTVPATPPPAPPSGPAAPAAKSKKKAGLDLSGLSDEARAKVEALRKSLAEERKRTTSELAAKEKAELAKLGVTLPEKKVVHRDTGAVGINLDYKVTTPQGSTAGWEKDAAPVKKAIDDAGGMTLKNLLARDDVGGWTWLRPKFVRNQLLLNGKNFTEIVNKGAA